MAKIMETVLYYNPGTPETMKHVARLKSVLVRMGIRIRNIGPDQVNQTVGYLAGVPGFEENADAGQLPVYRRTSAEPAQGGSSAHLPQGGAHGAQLRVDLLRAVQ